MEFSTRRDELIKKFGHKDEQGRDAIANNDPGFESFMKELKPLLEQKIDVAASSLKFSELAANESVTFPGSAISALFPFIEDDSSAVQ
jgi:hypothetical protein